MKKLFREFVILNLSKPRHSRKPESESNLFPKIWRYMCRYVLMLTVNTMTANKVPLNVLRRNPELCRRLVTLTALTTLLLQRHYCYCVLACLCFRLQPEYKLPCDLAKCHMVPGCSSVKPFGQRILRLTEAVWGSLYHKCTTAESWSAQAA